MVDSTVVETSTIEPTTITDDILVETTTVEETTTTEDVVSTNNENMSTDGILLTTEYYTITLPSWWKGKYGYEIYEEVASSFTSHGLCFRRSKAYLRYSNNC